jgi:superfamily II DNA or RNA helicase
MMDDRRPAGVRNMRTSPLLDNLLASPWRRDFARPSLERGVQYAQRGHVLGMRVDEAASADRVTVVAEVLGSNEQHYETEIRAERQGHRFVLETTCTCAVGTECKHAAAVLEALDRERIARVAEPSAPNDPFESWSRWFDRLGVLSAPAPEGEARQAIVYLLESVPNPSPIPGLRVRPVWVKEQSDGSLGDARALSAADIAQRTWVGAVDDAQFALMARILVSPSAHAHGSFGYALAGRRGEALLDELIATGRCYWRRVGGRPLTRGEPRNTQWQWRLMNDGSQRLTAQAGSARSVLRCDRLWFVDDERAMLGPLETDPAAMLAALEAPPLAPALSRRVAERWAEVGGLAGLPAPRALDTPVPWKAEPVPTLRLDRLLLKRAQPAVPKPYESVLFAELGFDYGGETVRAEPALSIEHRLQDERVIAIERDLSREREAESELRRNGLAPAPQSAEGNYASKGKLRADHYVAGDGRVDDVDALLTRVLPLRQRGFRLVFAPDFPVQVLDEEARLSARLDAGAKLPWFELELALEIDGQRIALLPIVLKALADRSLVLDARADEPPDALWYVPIDERRRVPIRRARVRELLAPLMEWLDGAAADSTRVRVPRLAASVLDGLDTDALGLDRKLLRKLSDALGKAREREATELPEDFGAVLRDYQREGLDWLEFLAHAGAGGVLADDMGLGKTVQVLAHALIERRRSGTRAPILVVCPTSVVHNWREQAERFAPKLTLIALRGADRAQRYAALATHDVAITTYPLLVRDRELLLEHEFALAVFDEAQAIKNPRAKAAQIAREIRAPRKLVVTGTPLENHLGELWAAVDLALPGLLGSERGFARHYRTPIEKQGDAAVGERLKRRIAPFLLRRRKEEVARELPPKTEVVQRIDLEGRQRELYESLRLAMHERVREAIAARGLEQSGIMVLDALLKLRQACCDPRLVKLEDAREIEESAKLEALLPMLEELIDEGRRILLFSQFTSMLDLIEVPLIEAGIRFVRLDGSTEDRETPVQRFRRGDVPLFLLSLKAGGAGLNLAQADTVIHYDPWWNPAVEAQATDRAHRIGQDKPVFVYKLICADTVEERIQALQQRKADLAAAVLGGAAPGAALKFDQSDIDALFAPLT